MRSLPRLIHAAEMAVFRPSAHPVRWKRSTGDFVESHCGRWWITPIYGGLTRPERYELSHNATGAIGGWKVVGTGQTQRECKSLAEGE